MKSKQIKYSGEVPSESGQHKRSSVRKCKCPELSHAMDQPKLRRAHGPATTRHDDAMDGPPMDLPKPATVQDAIGHHWMMVGRQYESVCMRFIDFHAPSVDPWPSGDIRQANNRPCSAILITFVVYGPAHIPKALDIVAA